ncbi:MAG: DUF3185 family protein [Verrucomicrobiota bacterium]
MNKIIGIALVAGGVVMLIYGFKAKDSLESKANELLRGSPSKNAVWLLGGGAACSLAGVAMIMMKK